MLVASYVIAAAAMLATAAYLFLRVRLFITTTAMLLGSLLIVYGPTFLTFTLSSGAYAFLIRPLTGGVGGPTFMFPAIKARIGDIDSVIIAMNFSVALMYAGIVAGVELINGMAPVRAAAANSACQNWTHQAVQDDLSSHRFLVAFILAVLLFMLFISIKEHHLDIISQFFSITDDNTARNLFRAHHGGSPNYLYRVVLSAVAPMLVIWGVFAGAIGRSRLLLAAVLLLLLATMLGKIETLSKAPPTFFLMQIMLAALLAYTNRISWRVAVSTICVLSLGIYLITRLIVIFPEHWSVVEATYSRVFEVENETLLENFAVFPKLHPFMWGANIRIIAALMGVSYVPSFSYVADVWYHSPDITSPTLFIADAWIDFSYAGVFFYSVLTGAICRSIDIAFLWRGKTAAAIAVLSATFWGVLVLLTTALNIALFSGGLLLAPALAAGLIAITRYFSKPLKCPPKLEAQSSS